ncbi:glycosyltransferase family 2 protein, partial [Candidatus Microgenomates bacterium]|nr:glycosyltransferase family 2 protein [Candidatus Microgenomates bacterium]
KTCQIAASYKAKIYTHPYTGFVEPARNFGIGKAKNGWILIVDADEEIPKSLVKYLLDVSKKGNYDYFRIPRKNLVFGKWIRHTGWYPDYQIRFFKKGSVNWTEKIHGVPETKGKGFDLKAEEELSIIHNNYQSLEQFLERLNRYTNIAAKEMYLSNKHFQVNNLFEAPVKEFINRYFIWEGYRDGLHGLALSTLQSFSEIVTCLKLWELEKFKEEKVTLADIDKMLTSEYRLKKFHLTETEIKKEESSWRKFVLKLKRKLAFYG